MLGGLISKRGVNTIRQMIYIIRYEVGQLAILAVVPNLLDRIQLRSVCWQPFHVNSSAKSPSKPSDARPMNHPAIDHQYDSLWKVEQQLYNKILKIIRANIGILHRKIQFQPVPFWRNTDGRNDRHSVATIPTVINGSLTPRRPGPPDRRLQHKAAFIEKYDSSAASSGFFLYAANLAFAKLRRHLHHALWHVFRVFDSSTPYLAECARYWRGHRKNQNGFRLPLRLSSGSTVQWNNHFDEHLLTTASPAGSSTPWINMAAAPADYELGKAFLRTAHKLFSTVSRPHQLPQPSEQFLECRVLVAARPQLSTL